MLYRSTQSGTHINIVPVKEVFTNADTDNLQLGDTITATDGSCYILQLISPISYTLTRLLLVPCPAAGGEA